MLSVKRKYNFIIDVRENFFQKKRNVTSFVGQTKRKSVLSVKRKYNFIINGGKESMVTVHLLHSDKLHKFLILFYDFAKKSWIVNKTNGVQNI